MATHTIDDILDHEGRAVLRGHFQRPPMAGIICPPTPGACALPGETDAPPSRCHVCGEPTEALQNARMHAVAGFEDAAHVRSGERLRILVTHCDGCVESAHCKADVTTPGNVGDAPFGFCEPMPPSVVSTNLMLFPGAHVLGRLLRWGVAASGLWLLSHAALVSSRGQATADFQGPTTSMWFPNTSVSGNGFNVGDLKVYTGSAPATADAAETGTLLIDWVLPNPAMGAPSAATPPVITAAAITNVNAAATGTAGYARILANGDTGALSTTQRRGQITVGTSGADLNFNTTSISSGGACSITSLTLTHG